ncbi:MAG TPA: hypothetical protein VGR29_11425 [Thermomicrobiales bacterium]|nr:hypothetical protein [Thermomicrobiales bacterium]
MNFELKRPGRSRFLQRPMNRRKLLHASALSTAGGLLLPGASGAQESSLDLPPSQNTSTPSAPIGARFNEGLLPDHRLIMYYGFPENPNMGILGEYPPEQLLPQLLEQKAEYEAVINDRPWKAGFELIASVAQREPGPDGKYIADTDGKWLDMYTQFTEANDMFLVLDVQMGLKTPKEDYEGLERWLRYDHVHLAIDPEFHVLPGETPGIELGSIDAADVAEAQAWLLQLAEKYGTSRKMLLIHQFNTYSVSNKDQIKPLEGVDLVLNMDGWGPPWQKLETWEVIIQQTPIEYNGVKVFYRQDEPIMTPAEVIALEPTPDVINYQ